MGGEELLTAFNTNTFTNGDATRGEIEKNLTTIRIERFCSNSDVINLLG